MKCSLTLLGFLLFTSGLWAQCDQFEFAEALETQGYNALAVKYYQSALKKGQVSEKQKDDIYLNLYKLLGRISAASSGDEATKLMAQAESYFSKIKDASQEEVQLERVKADLEALRQIHFQHQSKKDSTLDKKKVSNLFMNVAKVTDKIRNSSRKWLDEFDLLDDGDRRKQAKEYSRQIQLEVDASLQFGEACVMYASMLGHKDPEVKGWLEKMAKGYENFIANNYGSFAAIVGGIYYGQVCILLESYKDDYGDTVNGLEAGARAFSDAIVGLEEFASQKNMASYVDRWTVKAYNKHIEALEIVGKQDKAIDELKPLFDWKPLSEFTPRKNPSMHDQMLSALQKLCSLLKVSYDNGNAKRGTDLFDFTLKGYNFAKKTDSRWLPNFRKLLGDLPPDADVEETIDIAFMKAGDLFRKTKNLTGKAQEKAFLEAALKYKRVMGFLKTEPQELVDEMFPTTAFRLGRCHLALGNPLLALATFLRVVELYPSTRYTEKDFPDIFRNVRGSAVSAKSAAVTYYKVTNRHPFAQSLYEKTLGIISKQFPEEGGDPEFWMGSLRKSVGDYDVAKGLLSKIDKKSKMYFKALFSILDCDYRIMAESEKSGDLKGDALVKTRYELAKAYLDLSQRASKEIKKPQGMVEKDFQYMLTSKREVESSSSERMATLYYLAENYQKAYDSQLEMFKKSKSSMEKFKALKLMISCSYKLDDLKTLSTDLKKVEALKKDSSLSSTELNDFKASAMQMKSNLITKLNLNPLKMSMAGKSGSELKAIEKKLEPYYTEVADLFFESLMLNGDRNEDILKQVISYYYVVESTRDQALEAMNLYFQWYPKAPKLSVWYDEMLGKGLEAWDEKLGGHLNSINLTTVKSTYKTLLDQLFDKNDYSEMGLSQVRRTKKESGDEPRSYQAALKTIEELEGMANKDVKFKKSVLPSIVALKDSVSKANTYFAMRLQQAECLSLLKKYKEASSVFIALSKYFVEYPQIRIELAKAKVAQETKEGYLKAEKLFKDLLSVVPGPSVSSYEPMEFFSLQWWYTRTRLALSEEKGAKSTESVIEAWKYLRSMVYQDLGYIGKSERRFTQLRIAGTQKVNHEDMIDQFKTWVEQEIFPVLEKSNSPLKKDSWTSILGGEQ